MKFIVVYEDDAVQLCDEKRVSDLLDMADTIPMGFKVFVVKRGEFVPVTIGAIVRVDGEGGDVYGTSDLIAAGEVVGSVRHTDH